MSRPINFTDTTVTKKPYVEIDGIEYEVQDGTYQGGTDLNANTFNTMQDELNSFRNLFSTHLIQMNTDYRTTADFIKVEPNTTYILSSKDNNVTFQGNLLFYNANKEQLSQLYTFSQPFTTPSNCEYIKLVFANESAPLDAKIQLEEGTAKTSYTPWVGYIEESGSNDNGSYIKYSDGTMICTKKVKGTIDITKTWYMLYTGSLNLGSSPQTFITTPVVNYSMIGEYAFLGGSLSAKPTIDNLGSIMLIRPSSQSNTSYEIDIVAIGRWK